MFKIYLLSFILLFNVSYAWNASDETCPQHLTINCKADGNSGYSICKADKLPSELWQLSPPLHPLSAEIMEQTVNHLPTDITVNDDGRSILPPGQHIAQQLNMQTYGEIIKLNSNERFLGAYCFYAGVYDKEKLYIAGIYSKKSQPKFDKHWLISITDEDKTDFLLLCQDECVFTPQVSMP